MSFGWSAGDIAVTINLFLDKASALNDVQNVDGAKSHYQKDASYLHGLANVLSDLNTLSLDQTFFAQRRPMFSKRFFLQKSVPMWLFQTRLFLRSLSSLLDSGIRQTGRSHIPHGKRLRARYAILTFIPNLWQCEGDPNCCLGPRSRLQHISLKGKARLKICGPGFDLESKRFLA